MLWGGSEFKTDVYNISRLYKLSICDSITLSCLIFLTSNLKVNVTFERANNVFSLYPIFLEHKFIVVSVIYHFVREPFFRNALERLPNVIL